MLIPKFFFSYCFTTSFLLLFSVLTETVPQKSIITLSCSLRQSKFSDILMLHSSYPTDTFSRRFCDNAYFVFRFWWVVFNYVFFVLTDCFPIAAPSSTVFSNIQKWMGPAGSRCDSTMVESFSQMRTTQNHTHRPMLFWNHFARSYFDLLLKMQETAFIEHYPNLLQNELLLKAAFRVWE